MTLCFSEIEIQLEPEGKPIAARRGISWRILSLDEPELTAITIGDHRVSGKKVSRGDLENASIFGGGLAWGEAGPVPVAGAKGEVPVSVHICPVAQLMPEDRLQSGFEIKSEITIPAMRTRIAAGGIYESEPDNFSLLNVDA